MGAVHRKKTIQIYIDRNSHINPGVTTPIVECICYKKLVYFSKKKSEMENIFISDNSRCLLRLLVFLGHSLPSILCTVCLKGIIQIKVYLLLIPLHAILHYTSSENM